jgi:drug/metabolite transporter (DMT)-like permease
MSGQALALVLAAAVLHAVWNLAAKRINGADGVTFVWLYVVGSVVVWLPVAVVWVLVRHETPHWSWVLAGLLTALFHTVYQLVLQTGYERGDLNLVYPVARGTGPLLTFVVAVSVLGERPSAVAGAGVLAVVVGVLIIASGPATGRHPRLAGILWGAATGAAIAAYTLWDDHSVNALAVPPVPYFALGLLLQLPGLSLIRRGRGSIRETWRLTRGPVVAVALLSPLAYLLVLRAMQLAPVSLVAPARETSIVVGALFGWWVLHEPHPARRAVGAVVVLAGIAAIVAG